MRKLQRASLACLHLEQSARGKSKTLRTEAASAEDSLLDFDVQTIAQELAQNARTIAATVGNGVGVVAGTAAAIAIAAGATASAPALVVIAATGFLVSTGLGTGIGATLDVAAEAIAQGTASVSSLTNTAEFLVNQYVSLAETTIVSSAVTETMGPAAGNLAGAVDNAYQIMTSSTSPAVQDAQNSGNIGSAPVDMPDTFTVQQSATVDSTGGGDTVTITTTPATSTDVEVDIESPTGETQIDVTVTNGSGSFQIPASDSPVSGEDTVIQTMTDSMDDVAGSLDLSSVNTDDPALDPDNSDLDSTELPNPDLNDSVQADYGSSSGGGGGSESSSTLTGTYIATYIDNYQCETSSPYTCRQFTDSGAIIGTVNFADVVTALTVTSQDGLFPPGGLSSGGEGYLESGVSDLEVYSADGFTNWICFNGSVAVFGNGLLGNEISGSCTFTVQMNPDSSSVKAGVE